MLDGTRVDPSAVKRVTHGMILEAASELRALDEDIDDEDRLEHELSMQLTTTTNFKHSSKQESKQTVTCSRSAIDGNLPDTGSELTHGSSVVLAGNMAAAVRRRRQLIANGGTEQGAHNRSIDRHESTIDLLDAALERSDGSSLLGDGAGAFMREGDVTSSLMGSASLYVDPVVAYAEECSSPQLDSGCSRNGADSHKHFSLSLVDCTNRNSILHPTASGSMGMDTSFEVDSRPRSANSFIRSSGGIHNEAALSTSSLLVQSSPRQRNSSRPTTAACETPRRAAFAVPFKVDIDASIAQPRKARHQQIEESDALDSIDLEDECGSSASGAGAVSLVHLDIVKRKILTGYHYSAMHGDLADEEDICLTHADRHKLMSSSAVRSDANSATTNMKNRQHVLQQLKGTATQSVALNPSITSQRSSLLSSVTPSSRYKSTASMKAGISLGFNLAGSLAAIDKWVEEVDDNDSDDEATNDDDDDQSQCAVESCEDNYSSSSCRQKSQLLYSFGT